MKAQDLQFAKNLLCDSVPSHFPSVSFSNWKSVLKSDDETNLVPISRLSHLRYLFFQTSLHYEKAQELAFGVKKKSVVLLYLNLGFGA